jgi:hypothetical protein
MNGKEYRKKYYLEHREYFLAYRKKNYDENKDYINRKMKCEYCGRVVIARMYKQHCNTIIHNKGFPTKSAAPPKEKFPREKKKKKINEKNFHNGWVSFV